MIVLPHHMPYIRVGLNSLAICRHEWLEEKLKDAAIESDVPLWLAEDISDGIHKYLENSYEGTVIDSDELFTRISTTLNSVGLNQMAEKIDRSPPTVRISFTDLARRAGESYELAFFQLLEDKCSEVLESGASSVECHGLIACVQTLCQTEKWSTDAEEIKKQIIAKIDEFRRLGEVLNPVFNVSIIY